MKNLARTLVPLVLGVAIGFFVCKEYFCEPSCPTTPPSGKGIITVNKAIELHETYKNTRYQVINDAIGGPNDSTFLDTQFVWFEYEKMKSYMNYLETVQSKNPNNPRISGIRIYFGAYDAHEKYPKQQTIFLNPTVKIDQINTSDHKNHNMKNLPFYIKPNSDNDSLVGKYKVIRRLLLDEYNDYERAFMANSDLGHKEAKGKAMQKSANAKNGDDGTSLSFNIGHLSPPPPKG